jgi:hypothetical protein
VINGNGVTINIPGGGRIVLGHGHKMPTGLLIELNDGGKRMEITAGLRCPSFGANFDSGYQKAKYADIAGYVSGQVLFIPHATAYLDSGLLHKMNSVTISVAESRRTHDERQSISEREHVHVSRKPLADISTGQRRVKVCS